jgi:hypothetical protein
VKFVIFFKSSKLHFNPSVSHATHAFQLVHLDVWGSFYTSLDSFKYFVTFINYFSRVTWVYLLKAKSEIFDCFKDFHMLITNQFSTHLKIIRSDNGTECRSKDMSHYLCFNILLYRLVVLVHPNKMGFLNGKIMIYLEKLMS